MSARARVGVLVVLLLQLTASSGCGRRPDPGPTVRVGYYANVNHGAALVGLDRGLFARALGPGLRIEARSFVGAGDVITGLAAGELDLAYVGPGPAISALAHGAEIRILGQGSQGGAALVARADTPIRSVADLDGRRVVVPTLAGTQDICLRRLLAESGLRDRAEGGTVEILHAPPTDLKALFAARHVDAALIAEPWPSRLLADRDTPVRLILDGKQVWRRGRYPSSVLVASRAFLSARPELARRWIEGHEAARRLILAQRDQAAASMNRMIARELGKPLPPAALERAIANVRYTTEVDLEALQAFADLMRECGYLQQRLSARSLVAATRVAAAVSNRAAPERRAGCPSLVRS